MAKSPSFDGPEPETIYVVCWNDQFRLYIKEGQAINWFSKKISEGYNVKMWAYTQSQQLGV